MCIYGIKGKGILKELIKLATMLLYRLMAKNEELNFSDF